MSFAREIGYWCRQGTINIVCIWELHENKSYARTTEEVEKLEIGHVLRIVDGVELLPRATSICFQTKRRLR